MTLAIDSLTEVKCVSASSLPHSCQLFPGLPSCLLPLPLPRGKIGSEANGRGEAAFPAPLFLSSSSSSSSTTMTTTGLAQKRGKLTIHFLRPSWQIPSLDPPGPSSRSQSQPKNLHSQLNLKRSVSRYKIREISNCSHGLILIFLISAPS